MAITKFYFNEFNERANKGFFEEYLLEKLEEYQFPIRIDTLNSLKDIIVQRVKLDFWDEIVDKVEIIMIPQCTYSLGSKESFKWTHQYLIGINDYIYDPYAEHPMDHVEAYSYLQDFDLEKYMLSYPLDSNEFQGYVDKAN